MITMRLNALTGMGFTQRILVPAINNRVMNDRHKHYMCIVPTLSLVDQYAMHGLTATTSLRILRDEHPLADYSLLVLCDLDPAIIQHINEAYPHIEKWIISHAPHC